MNPHTKGYLEGLQAAALLCQEYSGDKHSHLSDKIMALHSRKMLEGEVTSHGKPYALIGHKAVISTDGIKFETHYGNDKING